LVDSAIRRRFRFIHLDPKSEPCSEILTKWLAKSGLPNSAAKLLENLNDALEPYNFAVGPAYFMKTSSQTKESLRLIWKYSIEPLLEEFFYGEWNQRYSEFAFEKMYP
jgi:5-methylcytosine-specific restriction protein B